MSDDDLLPTLAGGAQVATLEMGAVFQEGFLGVETMEDSGPVPIDGLDALAERINVLDRNSKWWLGDLLVYAAEHHGEMWHQLTDSIGHTTKEVSDVIFMAEMFPKTKRLIPTEGTPGLTWDRHRLFAKYYASSPGAAMKLMKRAARQNWDDARIRDEVRNATVVDVEEVDTKKKEATTTTFTISLTVPANEATRAKPLIDQAKKAAEKVLIDDGITITASSDRRSGKVTAEE